MYNVLGIGNALVDVMTRLENDDILYEFGLPKGSMQLVSNEFSNRLMAGTLGLDKRQSSGGSAANTIHGLAHLGIQTGFIGKIGKDNFGKFFENDMRQYGIQPILFHDLNETGRSVALVSPDSERTFATFLGASIGLHKEDITSNLYKGYNILHVEGYLVQNKELIKKTLRLAKANGLTVTFDMASYNVVADNIDFLKKMIHEYVDVIFANKQEAQVFTGENPNAALKVLAELSDIAVIKMGINGSIVRTGNKEFKIGIVKVNSIDTTGAGDLYASGFIYGMCKGLSVSQCGQLGAICGGYVTEVMGAKMEEERWTAVKEKISEIENSK